MNYWLFKSEPDEYSIDDLKRDKTTGWDGVRNYQARNFLRDEIKKGDQVLFYHSNAKPPGVAGVATVAKGGEVDPTQFDAKDSHFDPKAKKENPRWYWVTLRHKKTFKELISLTELKNCPELEGMPLLQRGQRLSVQPVSAEHFAFVCDQAR